VFDLNEAGAQEVAGEIESEGGRAIAVRVDVADADAVERGFAIVDESLGTADSGFFFAGIVEPNNVAETSVEFWERTMGINARGVFLCSKEVIKRALARKQPATIVNIASVNAFYVEAGISVYCASKGAVLALSRAMALDHARDGIRINCICPGQVDTPMLTPFLGEPGAREHFENTQAIGRMGKPEELAAVAVFLASDDASFIHGAAIVADGGMTIAAP
jgi:NAD(P)-dependent dehydrogenase (short-subunit alcohol dehydrogenase family)